MSSTKPLQSERRSVGPGDSFTFSVSPTEDARLVECQMPAGFRLESVKIGGASCPNESWKGIIVRANTVVETTVLNLKPPHPAGAPRAPEDFLEKDPFHACWFYEPLIVEPVTPSMPTPPAPTAPVSAKVASARANVAEKQKKAAIEREAPPPPDPREEFDLVMPREVSKHVRNHLRGAALHPFLTAEIVSVFDRAVASAKNNLTPGVNEVHVRLTREEVAYTRDAIEKGHLPLFPSGTPGAIALNDKFNVAVES